MAPSWFCAAVWTVISRSCSFDGLLASVCFPYRSFYNWKAIHPRKKVSDSLVTPEVVNLTDYSFNSILKYCCSQFQGDLRPEGGIRERYARVIEVSVQCQEGGSFLSDSFMIEIG